jgi:shikimate kinase
MKSFKNIVFLGMMGSGKTTVGKMISKKLNIDFFDIDQEIENKTKQSIRDIFEKKGEIFFRKLEEKITLAILRKNQGVISLGGGAFLNRNIQKEVLENHLSVWLKWDDITLIKRIKNSKKRPVVTKLNEDELKKIIK